MDPQKNLSLSLSLSLSPSLPPSPPFKSGGDTWIDEERVSTNLISNLPINIFPLFLLLTFPSYTVLCPSVVKDSMTPEQVTKAILDQIGIDSAVYRLGHNKVFMSLN